MAQFQQAVLDYLEHSQPATYDVLRREKRLRARVDELVAQLYEETERIRERLAEANPEMSDDQLRLEAEAMAVRQGLPTGESEVA